ncbi:MAG: tetratricopeptide repeat protein, partial [Hydrococcus sp. Prado102]|nr:tetratricopeptide repeat protein [Hydrococcus sp. Prado102]
MKRSLFNLLLFFLSLFFVFRIFPVFSQTPTQISAEQLIQQAERAYQSGNLSEAVENYQKALNFFQSQGHKELNNLAISSTNLCRIQLELGQAENALQNCQISTQIYSQLSDNNGRIRSQVYQAYALHKLGFYPHACLLLAQSVEISVKSCEELTPELVREKTHNLSQNLAPSLVTAWRILGDTLRSMGDLNKSQIILEKLTSIASDPDPAATLLSLGNTLTAIANLERDRQAEPQYNYLPWKCQVSSLSEQTKKHYKIALETYDRSLQKTSSQILKTKAKLNRFRGLLEISEYSQAATLADEIKLENLPLGQFKVYATINYSKNIACLQQQYFQKARFEESFIARLNEAIQDAKKNGDKATESYVIGSLGGLYEYLQKFPEAEAKTQEALYIAQEFPDLFYQWQWQLGRIFEAKGEQEKALQNYESAVENLETYRQSLLSINSDVQFSFRDNIEPLYKHLINLLLSDRESSTDFELTSYKQEEAFSKEKISRDAIYRVSTLLKPSILDFRFSNNPKSPSGSAVSTRRETEAVRSWGLPKWSNCRP